MSTLVLKASPTAAPDSATLWMADVRHALNARSTDYADCLSFLSNDERRRYASFIREQRRLEFLASRLLLRLAISQHLRIAADTIEVSVEADAPARLTLNDSTVAVPFFSLSHSNGIVACAISPDHALGLDIETYNPQHDPLAFSLATFSPAEHAWLLAQNEANRTAAFYQLWNSKEALYKLQCVQQRRPSVLPDMIDKNGRLFNEGPPYFVFPRPGPDIFVAICSMQALSPVTCIPTFSFHTGRNGTSIDRFFS